MKNEDELNALIFPQGGDEDASPLQDALICRVNFGDSGPLQELVDSRTLTREEWERLVRIRHAWPTHAPLYHQRGRTFGDRSASHTPFNRLAAEEVIKEKNRRLALPQYASAKSLARSELKELIRDLGMPRAEKQHPNGKDHDSERLILYLVHHADRWMKGQ
jgi:hypothetical protein